MKYSNYLLTGLRIVIGWHFLYEGIAKLYTTGWTAKMYLAESRWIFSDIFHWMAASPGTLKVVDFLNVWGLILIGLSLFAGLFVRWSSIAGAALLFMYFVAYPPIPGYTLGAFTEGSNLLVNKTLIEFFLMCVFITLHREYLFGADRLIKRWKDEKACIPVPSIKGEGSPNKRREIIRDLIGVPFLGAFAYAVYKKKDWDSYEEKFLSEKPDTTTGATLKSFNFTSLEELKGQIPKGKIGDIELSRVILGGNLIGGWAHSRDLKYVSKLVKVYHTDERVMMTLQLAEKCGINAILTNPQLIRVINKYRHETGSKIKFISDCGVATGFIDGINQSLKGGADAIYCQGDMADRLVQAGNYKVIAEGLELIRKHGKPAGIGAHRIETIKGCVEHGLKPDFWMKTIHHHNYWSAQHGGEWHDNIFCYKPQETIDFMNTLEQPWIGFKVLAAGAIQPKEGFQFAFDNGADFIAVGMYDFQVVDDVNIALDTLANVKRVRPWRG